MQMSGFLDKDAPKFSHELWKLCLSAQSNPQGVPKELLEAKKSELLQERVSSATSRVLHASFTRLRALLTVCRWRKSALARKPPDARTPSASVSATWTASASVSATTVVAEVAGAAEAAEVIASVATSIVGRGAIRDPHHQDAGVMMTTSTADPTARPTPTCPPVAATTTSVVAPQTAHARHRGVVVAARHRRSLVLAQRDAATPAVSARAPLRQRSARAPPRTTTAVSAATRTR